MHYIRLLRPAKLDFSDRKSSPVLSLLLTITTDLGDSFLVPDAPADLLISADSCRGTGTTGQSVLHEPERRVRWTAGLRVLDVKLRLRPYAGKGDVNCVVRIHPATQARPLGVLRAADVLPWRHGAEDESVRAGLIMPATVEVVQGVCAPVSARTLRLLDGAPDGEASPVDLDVKEDIGESIARHIWDAGVVTAAFVADACLLSGESVRDGVLPLKKGGVNILELGCGVGILGISIARVLSLAASMQGQGQGQLERATVLLTDLSEAEERARANIAKSKEECTRESGEVSDGEVELRYENLDWDEGARGRFGPLASSRPWDLVVLSDCTYNVDSLPALVGTLSALHAANLRCCREGNGDGTGSEAVWDKSSVLLATKTRHSSEQALFGLLDAHAWRCRVLKSIPLPRIGDEDERVEIYSLEKSANDG